MASTNTFAALLDQEQVVILDGAMGTEIEERGIKLANTRLWSSQLLIDDPAVVRDIHLAYLRAGSSIITTATYQASLEAFAAQGVDAQGARDHIRHAVKLAADARAQFLREQDEERAAAVAAGATPPTSRPRPLIGLSAGSYGAFLCDGSEFTGTYASKVTQQQMEDFHMERLLPIADDPEVDLLCFETVPCLAEVHALCNLLSTHPQLVHRRAWISCSCKDTLHLCHGELFAEQVVPALWACEQVVAVGINCTDPNYVAQLLRDANAKLQQLEKQQKQGGAAVTRTCPAPVLLCYPNSGEEWDGEHRCWKADAGPSVDAPPERFAHAAKEWVAAGARSVGGCCRTGPEHIRRLRQALLGRGGI